ncbi:MAG: hypothetical protein AB1742_05985 [bacterium]
MPKAEIEQFDSAAVIYRSVAQALRGRHYDPASVFPTGANAFAVLSSVMTRRGKVRLIEAAERFAGTRKKLARRVRAEEVAQRFAAGHRKRRYKTIVTGAPSGGVAHACALLGAPFLPAHFLYSFHDPTDPDDVTAYRKHGEELAGAILKNNPGVMIVNHYDPVHDRFLIKYVNHVRLKFTRLPDAYRKFIENRLMHDGRLIIANCTFPWRQYRIGENLYFQAGGLGDFSDTDFIEGNETLSEYKRKQGAKHPEGGWKLDAPLEIQPESEWGTPAGFADSAKEFADDRGIEYLELKFDHPGKYSELAYRLYALSCAKAGVRLNRVLLDCFTFLAPHAGLSLGVLPLWLPFNCSDSLRFAKRFLEAQGKTYDSIFLALVPTFCAPPDTPHAREWKKELQPFGAVTLIGTSAKAYPEDIRSFFRFLPDIHGKIKKIVLPELTPPDLEEIKIVHQNIIRGGTDSPKNPEVVRCS